MRRKQLSAVDPVTDETWVFISGRDGCVPLRWGGLHFEGGADWGCHLGRDYCENGMEGC